jgi:hypothetical protein
MQFGTPTLSGKFRFTQIKFQGYRQKTDNSNRKKGESNNVRENGWGRFMKTSE